MELKTIQELKNEKIRYYERFTKSQLINIILRKEFGELY